MRYLQPLVILFISVFCHSACKPEKTKVNPQQDPILLPDSFSSDCGVDESLVYTLAYKSLMAGGTDKMYKFYYDPSFRIAVLEYEGGKEDTYTYNNDGTVLRNIDNSVGLSDIEYELNSAGLPVKGYYLVNGNKGSNPIEYRYNSDGKFEGQVYFNGQSPISHKFWWQSGNIVSEANNFGHGGTDYAFEYYNVSGNQHLLPHFYFGDPFRPFQPLCAPTLHTAFTTDSLLHKIYEVRSGANFLVFELKNAMYDNFSRLSSYEFIEYALIPNFDTTGPAALESVPENHYRVTYSYRCK